MCTPICCIATKLYPKLHVYVYCVYVCVVCSVYVLCMYMCPCVAPCMTDKKCIYTCVCATVGCCVCIVPLCIYSEDVFVH